jgi:hypothetical protein
MNMRRPVAGDLITSAFDDNRLLLFVNEDLSLQPRRLEDGEVVVFLSTVCNGWHTKLSRVLTADGVVRFCFTEFMAKVS